MLALGYPVLLGIVVAALWAKGGKEWRRQLPFGDVAAVDVFVVYETAV